MKRLKKFEDIKIPINVGDTVLGGRFKNKKMVVKKIGKNSKGDITINNKPLLKFRLVKESIESDFEYYFGFLKDEGFAVFGERDYLRIYKPFFGNEFSSRNLKKFDWPEISDDVLRYLNEFEDNIDFCYVITMPKTGFDRKQVSVSDIKSENFDGDNIITFSILFKRGFTISHPQLFSSK